MFQDDFLFLADLVFTIGGPALEGKQQDTCVPRLG